MRVWLEILRERNPGVSWVIATQDEVQDETSRRESATVSFASDKAVTGSEAVAA